jgi:hypothetical protein
LQARRIYLPVADSPPEKGREPCVGVRASKDDRGTKQCPAAGMNRSDAIYTAGIGTMLFVVVKYPSRTAMPRRPSRLFGEYVARASFALVTLGYLIEGPPKPGVTATSGFFREYVRKNKANVRRIDCCATNGVTTQVQ